MYKPRNVVPISAGMTVSDPGDFTISVGGVPFRFRMGPDGGSTMIGPARLIDFPRAGIGDPLAKSPPESDECPDRGGRRGRRTKVKTFTIENGTNNIMIHASVKEAEAVPDSERFGNEAALGKLVV